MTDDSSKREQTVVEHAAALVDMLDAVEVQNPQMLDLIAAVRAYRALPATPAASAEADAAWVAQLFHEAYERLAPSFGYETRKASAVPWAAVPEPNRSLMVAVAGEVLAAIRSTSAVAQLMEKWRREAASCRRLQANDGDQSEWRYRADAIEQVLDDFDALSRSTPTPDATDAAWPGLCDNPKPHGPHQRSEEEACPGVPDATDAEAQR